MSWIRLRVALRAESCVGMMGNMRKSDEDGEFSRGLGRPGWSHLEGAEARRWGRSAGAAPGGGGGGGFLFSPLLVKPWAIGSSEWVG